MQQEKIINSDSNIANFNKTKALVEGAAMLALATVLGNIRIFKLPWGGAITLFSMLPILIYSLRRGIKNGLCVSFLFSLIQLFQGFIDGLLGWGLTPLMIFGVIFIDYIGAFTSLGLAGLFRKNKVSGNIIGIIFAVLLRFVFHVLSGIIIWHSFGQLWDGFYTTNEVLYSLVYNGAYMLPELVITLIGAIALMKLPKTRNLILNL